MRMTRLLSVLDGEAKKAVKTIGTSGIFYATALKTLKRDFGSPFLISHFRLKNLFGKPQIRPNGRTTLRQFHQEPKLTITWLMSVGYKVPTFSIDNLTKAIIRLPYQLCQRFYEFTKESNLIDGSVNLVTFEKWLEDQLRTSFNPLADIIIDKEQWNGIYNVADYFYTKIYPPTEIKDVNVNVFNMVTRINEAKTLLKCISCNCKCKINNKTFKSNEKCQSKFKKDHLCEKDYG